MDEENQGNKKLEAIEMKKRTFVRTMLEEKGLMDATMMVETEENGYFNIIEMEVLVSYIELVPQHQYDQIKNIMSIIDFKNGNIMHFMDHLAKGFAKAQAEVMGL